MTVEPASYRWHRFPDEIISHAAWLYHMISISRRDVELALAGRGAGHSGAGAAERRGCQAFVQAPVLHGPQFKP
jgi:hypothetical protein